MYIKLCGIQSIEELRQAEESGASHVGLNFVPSSKRCISLQRAQSLSPHAQKTQMVGVFMDQNAADICHIMEQAKLSWIQLHGDEPPQVCAALSDRYHLIKALRVEEAMREDLIFAYKPHVSFFLIDGKKPGSGETWNWEGLASKLTSARPFFLAGGLTSENVGRAIGALKPYGVDTASGIEENGKISAARIQSFCESVQNAALGVDRRQGEEPCV